MKLKFKVQPYQTAAVDSVVDCFQGQLYDSGLSYRIDPGKVEQEKQARIVADSFDGVRNADIALTPAQVLSNIQKVQGRQNIDRSAELVSSKVCRFNLDVEMETGTGKTYCYIKSMFELNKQYGWSKFIVVVPSIAIREGIYKSLQITGEHFAETYHKKARFFIYNSKRLHELESFSSDAGINVMVINIQAFNARGKDNRRIYEELDDFQSRRPIDVISRNNPILILDEPQKMEGKATTEALPKFNPLMILRYSATHKTKHNTVHRLDALDAYNLKLVKKIAVRGIQTRGLAGTNAYLYLEGIDISHSAPTARVDMEIKQAGGKVVRKTKRLSFGDDLYVKSGEMDQYKGFTVSQIDYNHDTVEFSSGHVLHAGQATGDITEGDIRRIQIRETIRAHLDKEKQLFGQGIKVLSLFFIDEVVKYRDYSRDDHQGDYARVFEEEYQKACDDYLAELAVDNEAFRAYLEKTQVGDTHKGYFSIDKKSKRLVDPKVGKKTGDTDDVDAYDLILKDKERLLSFDEPTRFIFSHSALREGWDNPNVFTMCMLKQSKHDDSRRQEVGRGLRISVNKHGDRQDNPATVHEINVLTVVASESYQEFVTKLQREIGETLVDRPRKADEDYFEGKVLQSPEGKQEVSPSMARAIYKYLLKNDYTTDDDGIADQYHQAKADGSLAALPDELQPYSESIFDLIDSVFDPSKLPPVGDDRKPKMNPLNKNFERKEFQALWSRINQKAIYQVDFDSSELVRKAIAALDQHLRVTKLEYTVVRGEQRDEMDGASLQRAAGFKVKESSPEYGQTVQSKVKYDLLGKIAENAQLTRKTVADILSGILPTVFDQFKQNPEHFIAEATRLIREQKATMVVEKLSYDTVSEQHAVDIFTAAQGKQDFTHAGEKLKRHIYDYVVTDSKGERQFVLDLDKSDEIVVYAKLPRGFQIPTPVGDYNPDWAIAFNAGKVKQIYFVAETKGSLSSLQLREIEKTKIDCAKKFFEKLSETQASDKVRYDVVTDYGSLKDIVGFNV